MSDLNLSDSHHNLPNYSEYTAEMAASDEEKVLEVARMMVMARTQLRLLVKVTREGKGVRQVQRS